MSDIAWTFFFPNCVDNIPMGIEIIKHTKLNNAIQISAKFVPESLAVS